MQLSKSALMCVMAMVLFLETAAADDLKRRGMLGIQFGQLSAEQREQLKLPPGAGMVIDGIVPNTAAQQAGLEARDVLVRIGDAPLDKPNALQTIMRQYYAGDTLKLTVLRAGQEVSKDLTLRERPRETSEEFQIIYDAAKVGPTRARVILTRPKDGTKLPAVLFIQSLTAQSIDFPPQAANHPYKRLLTELTKAGFVTMRVERIGVGDSEGTGATDGPLATDIAAFRAGLEKLKGYDFVDPARVFIFAHGSGTVAAPFVAKDTAVAGVAVFGGLSRPPMESLLETLQNLWKLNVMKPDEIAENTKRAAVFLQECIVEKRAPADVYAKHPELRGKLNDVIQEDQFMIGRHYSFLQQIADANVLAGWSAVKAPVLALWGQCDFQTNRRDHEAIAQAVNQAAPQRAKFVEVPGIDHLLRKSEDQEESFLGGGGPFNSVIVEKLVEWMRAQDKPQ